MQAMPHHQETVPKLRDSLWETLLCGPGIEHLEREGAVGLAEPAPVDDRRVRKACSNDRFELRAASGAPSFDLCSRPHSTHVNLRVKMQWTALASLKPAALVRNRVGHRF